jgi:FkbM family methyltransferase
MTLSPCNKKIKDISVIDEILSYLYFLEEVISETASYRKLFKNYLNVSFNLLRAKFPIRATLVNGKSVIFNNRTSIIYLVYTSNKEGVIYNIETDSWCFTYLQNSKGGEKLVKLYSGKGNGEVGNVFLKNAYSLLPVKGKIIIDVGANIGDSSIYFALRGAQKIIGIEPFPMNYEIAKNNIELNNFSDKIVLSLAGCAGVSGYTLVDPVYQEIGACILSNPSNSNDNQIITVPLWTLEYILNKNNIRSGALLKMDCEGCEYGAILFSTTKVLRRFSYIMIEYHYGYKKLRKKLEDAGFSVFTTRPRAHHRDYLYEFNHDKWMYVGYLFAENKYLNYEE